MGHSVEARKQRWADLLAKPTDGRKFVFRIGVRTPEPPPVVRAWPWLKAERIETAWQSYNAMLERAKWLDDDLVPYMPVATGTEIFAEALGCEVYRPEDNNPFAIPFAHTLHDAERIRAPRLEGTPLMQLFEIADELRRRGGPDALLTMVDMQSPMDIVAQIWDKTDLFVAMLQTPDVVLELAAKARALQTAFLDEWFRRYGAEHVAHYPDYYVRRGMTLSADEVGNVNPRMFHSSSWRSSTYSRSATAASASTAAPTRSISGRTSCSSRGCGSSTCTSRRRSWTRPMRSSARTRRRCTSISGTARCACCR